MASLNFINYVPHRAKKSEDRILWEEVKNGRIIHNLPQIIWSDRTPWRAANMWALERASTRGTDIKTVHSNFTAMHAYSNWLESTETDWQSFPIRKSDRCLVKYRGALIDERERGSLSPSTVTQRMTCVVQFYRWLQENKMISSENEMWKSRSANIKCINSIGFQRSISVETSDLSIPNRSSYGELLEDGLLPVSTKDRDLILSFARENCSEELFLMLTLGFYAGMRIGTIFDLKIETLERAAPDPSSPNLFKLSIGPGADPPVHTKFGVTGQIWIAKVHLEAMLAYAYSVRRLKREAKAANENKTLLFLTRFGNSYSTRGSNKSSAINVEMLGLRRKMLANGISIFRHFHFHQTRCTFATELARMAIAAGGSIYAIAVVREALLHKRESTSIKYIRFVEKTPIKIEMGNEFTREFLGLFQK